MRDEAGVDFLGMRLIVVLIVAALLISAAATYVEIYGDRYSRDLARRESARIANLACAEYAAAGPGSDTRICVSIPRCVKRLSFAGGAYSIEFIDGVNETYASSCTFSPAVVYPGDQCLEIGITSDGSHAVSLEAAQDA